MYVYALLYLVLQNANAKILKFEIQYIYDCPISQNARTYTIQRPQINSLTSTPNNVTPIQVGNLVAVNQTDLKHNFGRVLDA